MVELVVIAAFACTALLIVALAASWQVYRAREKEYGRLKEIKHGILDRDRANDQAVLGELVKGKRSVSEILSNYIPERQSRVLPPEIADSLSDTWSDGDVASLLQEQGRSTLRALGRRLAFRTAAWVLGIIVVFGLAGLVQYVRMQWGASPAASPSTAVAPAKFNDPFANPGVQP